VAEKTIERFLARAVRLYEQEQEEPFSSPLLGLYVLRWMRWIRGIASVNRLAVSEETADLKKLHKMF